MRREDYTTLYKVLDDTSNDEPTYVVRELLAKVTPKLVEFKHSYPGIAGVRYPRTQHDPIGVHFYRTAREAVVAFGERQRVLAHSLERQRERAITAWRWAVDQVDNPALDPK